MRKLTSQERLQNWQGCRYVTDWECDQCPDFLKFTSLEEEIAYKDDENGNGPIGVCGDSLNGVRDPIYPCQDKRCYCRICELCTSNEKCAIQARAARFIEEFDHLWTHTEFEDIPLLQSLVLKEILCVIAKRCPYFKHKVFEPKV